MVLSLIVCFLKGAKRFGGGVLNPVRAGDNALVGCLVGPAFGRVRSRVTRRLCAAPRVLARSRQHNRAGGRFSARRERGGSQGRRRKMGGGRTGGRAPQRAAEIRGGASQRRAGAKGARRTASKGPRAHHHAPLCCRGRACGLSVRVRALCPCPHAGIPVPLHVRVRGCAAVRVCARTLDGTRTVEHGACVGRARLVLLLRRHSTPSVPSLPRSLPAPLTLGCALV